MKKSTRTNQSSHVSTRQKQKTVQSQQNLKWTGCQKHQRSHSVSYFVVNVLTVKSAAAGWSLCGPVIRIDQKNQESHYKSRGWYHYPCLRSNCPLNIVPALQHVFNISQHSNGSNIIRTCFNGGVVLCLGRSDKSRDTNGLLICLRVTKTYWKCVETCPLCWKTLEKIPTSESNPLNDSPGFMAVSSYSRLYTLNNLKPCSNFTERGGGGMWDKIKTTQKGRGERGASELKPPCKKPRNIAGIRITICITTWGFPALKRHQCGSHNTKS